jgi:hypothetical protein
LASSLNWKRWMDMDQNLNCELEFETFVCLKYYTVNFKVFFWVKLKKKSLGMELILEFSQVKRSYILQEILRLYMKIFVCEGIRLLHQSWVLILVLIGIFVIDLFRNFITRNLKNTNKNTDKIFSVSIFRRILLTNFSIAIFLSKHWWKYFVGIYWGNCNEKKKTKKVWWRITFTNDFTDRIKLMIKFFHWYIDKNNLSVYINEIIDGIIMGFKKINFTKT